MLRQLPLVIPMAAISRGVMVTMFMFLSLVTFRCLAEDAVPAVQICDVLKNIDGFDGGLVELYSDIRITMHGRYLIGKECRELGSLSLVINDKEYKNRRVKQLVRNMYSNGGRFGVVLVGYPSKVTFNSTNGSFILQDVRSSSDRLDAYAKNRPPAIDICKLVANPGQYDEQRIELHTNVVAEPHGYHLVGSDCLNGSVGLVVPERSANDAKFTSMMQRIMAHHARGQVVIVGVFHAGQANHQVGTLTIDDVISVTTTD
jgi:hypothetical protein